MLGYSKGRRQLGGRGPDPGVLRSRDFILNVVGGYPMISPWEIAVLDSPLETAQGRGWVGRRQIQSPVFQLRSCIMNSMRNCFLNKVREKGEKG